MSLTILPSARNKAIQYLAMREHSYLELTRKLQQKGFENTEIDLALAKLVADNLLSDTRFGEAFVRSKALKGQGPVRIRMALKEKGLDKSQIAYVFSVNSHIDWDALIEQVFAKKFTIVEEACSDDEGSGVDDGANDESTSDENVVSRTGNHHNNAANSAVSSAVKAKQWRFLQYRGFTQTQISELFHRLRHSTPQS